MAEEVLFDAKDGQTVPARFAGLFWDCDFAGLSLVDHSAFIIRRVLDRGDWESIQWLRKTVGDQAIAAWFLQKQGGGLDPRKLRFWELVLDLPKAEVDAWVTAARASIWGRRNH